MPKLSIRRQCVIRRPIEVVRAQFLDFDHHIAAGVHAGLQFTVISRDGGRQRVRQSFKVFGMPKRDLIEVYADDAGNVVQEFIEGDFAGGRLVARFRARDAGTTEIQAELDAPLRGINALLAPLLRRVVARLADQSLAEDRRDLEERGYQPASAVSTAA